MTEKINWTDFHYPKGCLLSDNAQATLSKIASSGKCDPFVQCRKIISGESPEDAKKECTEEIQEKCLKAVEEYEARVQTAST
ncbi:MAG TPA: hypothetical protein VK254_00945 [Candidatus Bathyarchaeia archaeon]|nr:hypothetical protein [Candidatus Bathyarchaeia archaeon]